MQFLFRIKVSIPEALIIHRQELFGKKKEELEIIASEIRKSIEQPQKQEKQKDRVQQSRPLCIQQI